MLTALTMHQFCIKPICYSDKISAHHEQTLSLHTFKDPLFAYSVRDLLIIPL